MSGLLPTRDYQDEAIEALFAGWQQGQNRLAVVLPTGVGKTVIFAHLISRWTRTNVSKRVLVLVHTDELVKQAVKKIKDVAPHLHVGIVKAARNDVTARVIVASVQSLRAASRREQIRNVGLVICDEVHHCTANTYRAIFEHYGCMSGATLLAGFTATLARSDRAKISDIIQGVAYQKSLAWAIRRGYLLDVRGKRIVVPNLDLKAVKQSRGDYQGAALGKAMEAVFAPSVIAAAYLEHAADRKGIAFWPLVATARHGAEAFAAAGIRSAVLHGGTPDEERRLILKRLRAGDVQVVHNVNVLMEGFDEPSISCVVNARPTRSAPAYQQMVGRGPRPDLTLPPDRRGDCLVLDCVGVSLRQDLRTLIDLSVRAPDGQEMRDGESLLDLEDALDAMEAEQEGGASADGEDEYVGEVAAQDFDPLARSGAAAWLRTHAGTYFLPVGNEAYVLIIEGVEPSTFDVAWLTQTSAQRINGKQGDCTEHVGLSLEMACGWAEEVLEELGGPKAEQRGTQGGWRNRAMTMPQKKTLARQGLTSRPGMKYGEANDLIDIHLGSRRIDPVVGFLALAREETDEQPPG